MMMMMLIKQLPVTVCDGPRNPIQTLRFMNAPKLNPLKRDEQSLR